MPTKFDQLEKERRENEARKREVYAEIYGELTAAEGTIEVMIGEMPFGKAFYTFQTTAEWIAANINLVGELDMFNKDNGVYERIGNEIGNIEITSDNIGLIRQRTVDFSRAATIARYLLLHPFHNLPDMVVVVSAPWVDDPNAPEWKEGRAQVDSCSIESIQSDIDKVLLHLGKPGQANRHKLYALDGQHRLIGIRAAIDMLKYKSIPTRKPDGTQVKNGNETLEEWLDSVEEIGVTMSDALKFPSERVGIKLVPAVCKGETWEEAIQRLASIFKAFNTTSVAVSAGAAVAMDMEDGFAITTRAVYRECDFLKDVKQGSGSSAKRPQRVSPIHNTIAKKSTLLTTLATIKSMAVEYFRNNPSFGDWFQKTGRNTMGQPPSQQAVADATKQFLDFWNRFAKLPSMVSIEPWELLPSDVQANVPPGREARNVAEMRRFPEFDENGALVKDGEAHMLFRPLGQQALASAAGVLVNDTLQPMTLDQIFDILGRYDAAGGFKLVDRTNPWWGVLYDQTKDKIVTRGAKLAGELLVYMLSGSVPRGAENLRLAFAAERKSSTPDRYVDLNGNDVPLDKLMLPSRLH